MIRTELIRPVPALLADHAVSRGETVAFEDPRRSVTYGELHTRTGHFAAHLVDRGLEPGERVAILLPNGVETVEAYLGTLRASGVGVCLNPAEPPSDVAFKLSDSQARILVTDPAYASRIAGELADLPDLRFVVTTGGDDGSDDLPPGTDVASYDALTAGGAGASPRDDLSLDAPAWMLYTSGTTGRPKGVLLSQRGNLWVVAACWAPICRLGADDYVLSPLPLFHSYALNLSVLGIVAVGAREYIMSRFSTTEALRLLRQRPFTFLPGVPTMFHFLLEAARDRGLGAEALRRCVSAGAIMPARLNQEFEDAFGVQLLDGYGITETSTMVTENWPTGTRIMGSCGLPVPGSSVRIVGPETGRDADVGQEGEVWVRGPHVMLGYHNRPEETAEALRDGWYRTGDLAHADEHGYLTITGRIKELVIRGGQNIAPIEVEEVVMTHESVRDCAVAGVPHEALGEVPVAFVVPRDPATFDPGALRAHCTERLAPYKVPADIRVLEEIPRTGSGKVQRYKLSQQG